MTIYDAMHAMAERIRDADPAVAEQLDDLADSVTPVQPGSRQKEEAMSDPMRAYLVSIDNCDYDEYDAFVVVAAGEDDARALVAERFAPNSSYDHYKRQREAFATATVVEVDLTRRGEVLGSFNAG